jgi:maltose/maltodextrin transport system permease protein
VLFSTAIGMTLAVLLNWEALKYRTAVPHAAVPALCGAGLHLHPGVQGLVQPELRRDQCHPGMRCSASSPAWFADPFLAKVMILIVNTWLGYPYIMVLCTGLIKAIPADLVRGLGHCRRRAADQFLRITAPLIASR